MVNIGVASNEKIELYQEDGKYYLRLDFDYENSDGYYKVHVDRILFDFHLCSINRLLSEHGQKTTINLGVEKIWNCYLMKMGTISHANLLSIKLVK